MIKCNLGSKDNSRCSYSGENTVTCPLKEACWTPICSHNSYYNPARLPSNVPDKRAPTVGKHRDRRLPVQHAKDLHRSNAKVASLQLRRCRVDLAECWSLLATMAVFSASGDSRRLWSGRGRVGVCCVKASGSSD